VASVIPVASSGAPPEETTSCMKLSLTGTLHLTVLILALLSVAGLVGCEAPPSQVTQQVQTPPQTSGPTAAHPHGAGEGDPAPDFDLPKAGGGRARLSDYKGKILVLDFWGTRCLGCIEALPKYQKLYDSWDHDKVEYLGPANDIKIEIVEAFLKRKKLTLPMALIDDTMKQAYLGDQPVLPQARVIDQEGVVRHVFAGQAQVEKVKKAVEELLAEAK